MAEIDAERIAKGLQKPERTAKGWTACCPAHDDSSPSLTIADGNNGYPIVKCHTGCTQDEVIDALKKLELWPEFKKKEEPKAKKKAPLNIVKAYDYFDPTTGELIYQVCRLEPKDFRQRKPMPGGGWSWTVPEKDRTLYNLVAVTKADPRKIVFVVEGEKDVDGLAEWDIVATCNSGGAGKWLPRYAEFLRDRHVILIRDNDPQSTNKQTGELRWHPDGRPVLPGQDHMDDVGRSLIGIAKSVKLLDLPGLPLKGDFTDWRLAGGTKDALVDLVRNAAVPWEPPAVPERPAEDEHIPPWEGEPEAHNFGGNETVYGHTPVLDSAPFACLGYDDGYFYYLPWGAQQVVRLSSAGHTKSNLLALAPLSFWEDLTGGDTGKTGFNVDYAANVLIQTSYSRGLFSMERVRGRGAWWDGNRVVVHVGDRAYINGLETPLTEIGGPFVYERGHELEVNLDCPLSAEEAARFLAGIRMMTWASELDSLLAAGWCVCAHIGGILDWRPHIWIIGAKGSGKTFFMEKFLKPVLGDNQANGKEGFVGETTEAGVRQTIGGDALPVVMDEAEGETSKAVQRIQGVLALARQSSSGTGKITKGTATGNSLTYQVRSCFAFSSINAAIIQASDQSRISVLELKPKGHKHTLADLNRTVYELFLGDYAPRFFARAISKAPMIREAARTFSAAAAIMFGEQRAGDQYGTLLAGAWSLGHDIAPTLEIAEEWLASFDWTSTTDDVTGQDDAEKCLERLMGTTIKVDTSNGNKTFTIAELVQACVGRSDVMARDVAQAALNRTGLKVQDKFLFVANSGPETERLLRDTPWAVNWNKVLVRLPGAEKAAATSFGSRYNQKKAVKIPL
jgi:putative DNA primase/helicase